MDWRIGVVLLVAGGLLFAGLSGSTFLDPFSQSHQPIDESDAKERVMDAEESRVFQALGDISSVSGTSVGVYREPSATIISENSSGLSVRVEMPYSYEYNCSESGGGGAVDGLRTEAVYQVTREETTLVAVQSDVKAPC